ncbi:MAG: CopG family transcriptional regulator [Deltaproteobacteria bacterium]|nr:CopG family transcriptional regulator [Deltaproteobacteria bacterium]
MKKKSFLKKFKTETEMDQALEYQDLSREFSEKGVLKKPHIKKINLDLPEEIVRQIDRIAEKMGVSRQPLLKIWIHERLKEEKS